METDTIVPPYSLPEVARTDCIIRLKSLQSLKKKSLYNQEEFGGPRGTMDGSVESPVDVS